ncbi:mechanosensitive ion channel domain-containing protein [Rhizobium grahamii]|uniref:Mechanosensitive ion channel protein n=1 Tax=Rhizobium grahamii TaxID=1120045 RepID=A0A370KTJ4_9HYPH|nr:mechanosensitive ion channel domain-containing protein [Rhizobium grahamii]RDJ13935.1 mechanosensitive ion channel protein [Rhizobium grahamii]
MSTIYDAWHTGAPSEVFGSPIVQFALLLILSAAARLTVLRTTPLKLVNNLLFLSVLTFVLLSNGIRPYLADTKPEDLSWRIFTGVAKAVWWMAAALVLVSFVRIFLILERKPRDGRLLQDVVVGVVYLGAGLSIIGDVFGVPVGTLIATSGVFAIVLGLALQSTLNDVFSGITLNLGRPYSVGDWVALDDGIEGRVIETNWRSTHLLTATNDLTIVPNSTMAKRRLTNLTSPDRVHGTTVSLRLLATHRPSTIEQIMREVLLSSNVVLKVPPPSVGIVAVDADAVEVELSFRVAGIDLATQAKNEIFDLAFRHTKAAGLRLASHPGSIRIVSSEDTSVLATDEGGARRLIDALPLFATLTDDEKASLASGMNRLTFKQGKLLAFQESVMDSLMILRSGVAVVEKVGANGPIEIRRLAPGDFFGERGVLMGAPEPGNVRTLTQVVAYEARKDLVAAVMGERASLADELGQVLSRRLEMEKHLFDDHAVIEAHHPSTLSARIRHFFELQNGAGQHREIDAVDR